MNRHYFVKKTVIGGALLVLSFASVGCTNTKTQEIVKEYGVLKADKDPYNATINSIVSTDIYGRSFGEGDVASSDRRVGMFYFIWHGEHVYNGINDVTKFMSTEEGNKELWDINSTIAKPYEFYYFDEPLYGYYCSDDPYVLTKHIELLTMSGIDYISLDLTNISIYEKNTRAVLEKLLEFQNKGWKVPLVTSFITGTDVSLNHPGRVLQFYNTFYADSRYDSLWFRDENTGKPIVEVDRVSYYSKLDPIVTANLTIRNTIWPYDKRATQFDDASWMDWEYPQRVYENSDGNYMPVSVAQHVGGAFGDSVNPYLKDVRNLRTDYAKKHNTFDTGGETLYDSNRGRGWDYELNKNVPENAFKGTNLETQWQNALNSEKTIDEVFVTGWNEWIAYKYPLSMLHPNDDDIYGEYLDYVTFCDTCNDEFSRDLEMTKGSYGDNFYLQNMRLTRQFKFGSSITYAGAYATQDIKSYDWKNARTYLDFEGDAIGRDFDRADHKEKYINDTNRNDIVETKMAHDDKNLYLQIKTADNIIIDEEKDNNLNVWLGIKGLSAPSFDNHQFVLNRSGLKNGEGTSSLEKVSKDGEFDFESAGECPFVMDKNVLSMSIPLESLGIKEGDFTVDFKIADGISDSSDIMNFYLDGDSAPIGRLNYRYNSNQI